MEELTTLDWDFVQAVLISLGIGGIIGLERQRHQEAYGREGEALGMRTFALASLLGTVSVLAEDVVAGMLWITGAGFCLIILAYLFFEFRERETMPGITTEVAALLVFVIGALVPEMPVFAAALGVVVAIILSLKDYTHGLVEKLSEAEVAAALKFLLVSVVLLPLLPNEPVDPWGIYNPWELWLLVVIISGISFVGYFAIRFLGRRRGIALTGVLGGLASSTAVTLAMSQRVKETDDDRVVRLAATFAILIANAIMSVRVTIVVAAINPQLLGDLWLPVVAMALPGSAVAGYLWWKLARDTPSGEVDMENRERAELDISNPFRLVPALKFALLFIVIIGLVHVAREYFGSQGTYAAAFLSGLVEANAISIALARMEEAASIPVSLAVRGIVIAILANSFIKAGLGAVLGSRKLGVWVAIGLVPMLVAGIAAAFLLL